MELSQFMLIPDAISLPLTRVNVRMRTSKGINQYNQRVVREQIRREVEYLDKPTPRVFLWTKQGIKTYKNSVVKINKCYSQISKIDRSDFFAGHKHNLMYSSTKQGLTKAVKSINDIYENHRDAGEIELPKTSAIPKIINNSNLIQQEFKQKEATFQFKHDMLKYQIRTYHKCKENKDVMVDSMEELNNKYSCKSSAPCYQKNR